MEDKDCSPDTRTDRGKREQHGEGEGGLQGGVPEGISLPVPSADFNVINNNNNDARGVCISGHHANHHLDGERHGDNDTAIGGTSIHIHRGVSHARAAGEIEGEAKMEAENSASAAVATGEEANDGLPLPATASDNIDGLTPGYASGGGDFGGGVVPARNIESAVHRAVGSGGVVEGREGVAGGGGGLIADSGSDVDDDETGGDMFLLGSPDAGQGQGDMAVEVPG